MIKFKILIVLIALCALSGCKSGGGGSGNGYSNDFSSSNLVEGQLAEMPFSTTRYRDTSELGNDVPAPVPEPGTLVLLTIGLGGLATTALKKKFFDKASR